MSTTLDTIISFVVILVGLSMTNQLLTNIAKNALHLRWRVYISFLRGFYAELFDLERGRQRVGSGPADMQSVTERLGTFANHLQAFWTATRSLRLELITIRNGLRAAQGEMAKQDYLVERSEQKYPELSVSVAKLRSLHPDKLLALYQALRAQTPDPDGEPGDGPATTALTKADGQLRALQELVEGWNKIRTGTTPIAGAFQKKLEGLLTWLTDLEAEVGNVCTRVDSNLDDAMARLRGMYARWMKVCCFLIAVVLCAALNADAIGMFRKLQDSPEVRQSLIADRKELTAVIEPAVKPEDLNELQNARLALSEAADRGDDQAAAASHAAWSSAFERVHRSVGANLDALRQAEDPSDPIDTSRADAKLAAAVTTFAAAGGDPPVRDWVVVAASARTASDQLGTAVAYSIAANVEGRLAVLLSGPLPLGWQASPFTTVGSTLLWLLGVLATSLAISFGAPLWNDILAAIVGIRERVAPAPTPTPSPQPRAED